MSKKISKFLCFCVIFLIICISFFSFPVVNADSGWDSSYSSGGGSSGGGYSSGDYSGDPLEFFKISVFFIVIFVAYISFPNKGKNNNISSDSPYPFKDITQEDLASIMPGVNLLTLKRQIFDNFVEIQNAWMNFDYNKLRELCTDELYNSYIAQLEILKLKSGKNIMSDFREIRTEIFSIRKVNGVLILDAFMKVEFYDYVINTVNNEVIRGNNSRKLTNNYILTYIMDANYINENTTKCPNCTAPIAHITSGECEYCHSTIVKKSSKFVLSKKVVSINK